VDLGSFLQAILTDWIALLSGAASVVLSFLGAIGRKELPRWVWWTAAAVCFLLASCRVWTSQYRRANNLQVNINEQINPKLSCSIDQAGEASKENVVPGNSVVLLIATVRNTGAPSTAEDYTLKVKLLDDSEVPGLLLTIPERYQINYPNGFIRIVRDTQALYNKTIKAIGHNEISRGFLLFQLTGLSAERLSAAGKEYDLNLKDVTGKSVSCSSKPDQTGPNTFSRFPGLDDSK
jgi:hypothetical protein